MNTPGPILVALDFSPECPLILEFAQKLAKDSMNDLLLLHVAGFRDPLRQRPPALMTRPLEDCAQRITEIPAVRVKMLMLEGEAIAGILHAAERHGCPIIVMGRGGTATRPGHVSLGVQKQFTGQLHIVSRFPGEICAA